jgi:membrane protein YqaA with SNARE-associated domain
MFKKLYQKTIHLARHRHAVRFLAALSFAEASFFPVPPDLMLAPMVVAKPEAVWRYARIVTFFSVCGGILGYAIGFLLSGQLEALMRALHYHHVYLLILHWFDVWGWMIVFMVGFLPVPYKIFTITAGSFHLHFLLFCLGSLIGRGLRFFLVCGALRLGDRRILNIVPFWFRRAVLILGLFAVGTLCYYYVL